jgi:hypothetical protein
VLGVSGLDGVDGAVVVDPPALDGDEPDPDAALEELLVVEVAAVVVVVVLEVAVLAFASGSGVKGLRAVPRCWVETPLVTSATAVSGLVWLVCRPVEATTGPVETAAGGAGLLEPPPSTE